MGICLNCIYKGDKVNDNRRNPQLRKEDFICKNTNNSFTDYITGESQLGTCRCCNGIGECPYFDDGKIPLYAWKGNNIVYTLSKEPDITDSIRNENNEIQGQIYDVNSEMRYAWVSINKVYWTKSETPAVDDDVYDSENTVIGKVSSVSEEEIKFTVDNISFTVTYNDYGNLELHYISDSELNIYYRNIEHDIEYEP